jgi:hypothetical protein
MTFMPLAVAVAVLLVVATRGSLLRLGRLPLRGLDLLFAGLGTQVVLALVDIPHSRLDDVGFGLLIASYALILTFCFSNFHVRGMAIVAVGIGLNALVIALNQGMPANGPTRTGADGGRVSRVITSVKHRPERAGDLLTVLDDRIALPRPSHDLLSFGDLVLVAGLLDICFWGSRRDDDAWMSVFAMPVPAPAGPRTEHPGRSTHDNNEPRTDQGEPAVAPPVVGAANHAIDAPESRIPESGTPESRIPESDITDADDNADFLADDHMVDLRESNERAQTGETALRVTTRSSAASTPSSYR